MDFLIAPDVASGDYLVRGRISRIDVAMHQELITKMVIEKVATAISERYLGDHAQNIAALLNPEAIANLAIADAAGSIREALHKKLPDKIVEIERTNTEVWQRGIFGGIKRIR